MNNEKVVIVGGSSGMGLAAAEQLAGLGYQVALSARTQARATQAAALVGKGAAGHPLDYHDAASISSFFEAVGAFDHLVLAGGEGAAWGPFEGITMEALERAFMGKFFGYFQALKAALPTLRKDGSATLLTGAAARAEMPGTSGLAAVNGAIERMGLTLAKELAPLRVNVLSPGLVDTPAYDWMPAEQKAAMLAGAAAKLPVGRYGRPEDLAAAVVFLVQNRFVTGTVLDVDGGIRLG